MVFTMQDAREWFLTNWEVGVCDSASAATLLRIKRATLKTRVSRGQAYALKTPLGEVRSNVMFTPYHLVFNMIQDRLARFGILPEAPEGPESVHIRAFCDWIRDEVLVNDAQDAIIRVRFDDEDGLPRYDPFIDPTPTWPADASLSIPVGHMTLRLAAGAYYASKAARAA